jgi:hypothetical protein
VGTALGRRVGLIVGSAVGADVSSVSQERLKEENVKIKAREFMK